MSEITAENINKLICNEVSQHMEQVNRAEEIVKIRRVRTEKQKENDVKLKDRLTEYHKKKKEAKEELVRMKHINDTLNELIKDEENVIELQEEEIKQLINVEITKKNKGRPKKIKQEYPGPIAELQI